MTVEACVSGHLFVKYSGNCYLSEDGAAVGTTTEAGEEGEEETMDEKFIG